MSKRHSSRIHRIIRNITHIYCGNHISCRTCYRNLHIFTLPNNGYMCLLRSRKLFLFFFVRLSFFLCVVCLFLLFSPDNFFHFLIFCVFLQYWVFSLRCPWIHSQINSLLAIFFLSLSCVLRFFCFRRQIK